MNKIGKWIFAIAFIGLGVLTLQVAGMKAAMVPGFLPGGIIWVYIACLIQILFGVSVLIGRWDKFFAQLTALNFVVIILGVHLGGASYMQLFHELVFVGAALMYADRFAKDSTCAIK